MKVTTVLTHLAGILFFLSIPLVFSPELRLGLEIQRELLGYSLMVGFFYLNYLVLIPQLYFKKKYIWFIVAILGCYFFITFLPQLLIPFADRFEMRPGRPAPPPGMERPLNPALIRHLSHTVFSFFLVVFVSLAMRINRKLKATEQERVQTELSLLKAQVNPHFLFNTLNSIYSLALEKSDMTADAIVKLSGMMRYVLHDAQQDVVSLSREVESLSDYIDLQMIRWENSVNVDYRVSGETDGKYIAPVILQPFIENAFKHGVSTEAETQINIMIIIEGEQLKLSVENEKVKLTNQHEERSGMGIENTRLRLNLIYPSVHTLTITENEHTFQVALTLKLKTGNA
uniref:Histidine kinase n=1 Tax=Roseihalotalea indica TaxID=2867963 RepID=A0AA49GJ93_9BACT|nr:histidine kinase [Tunicatimonas sp. TK19036]